MKSAPGPFERRRGQRVRYGQPRDGREEGRRGGRDGQRVSCVTNEPKLVRAGGRAGGEGRKRREGTSALLLFGQAGRRGRREGLSGGDEGGGERPQGRGKRGVCVLKRVGARGPLGRPAQPPPPLAPSCPSRSPSWVPACAPDERTRRRRRARCAQDEERRGPTRRTDRGQGRTSCRRRSARSCRTGGRPPS